MSYDLEIGTHLKPDRGQVETWAAQRELRVEEDCGGFTIVRANPKRGDGHVLRVDGPTPAEADDFDEAVAGACLVPRWMMQLQVPSGTAKNAQTHARTLAKHLAAANEGAAYDPQEQRLLYPTAALKRVEPRRKSERIGVVELEWFIAEDRWAQAPEMLLRHIRRFCPEALPKRYGDFEPPPHRYDPDAPQAFIDTVLHPLDRSGFWFAARPSFGGSWHAPERDFFSTDARARLGRLKLSFDGRVLEQDSRWRSTVVDLFAHVAEELDVLFAVARLERNWIVTGGNRLWADGRTESSEYLLGRGGFWPGLPTTPAWLTWFGEPYVDLVAPHLTPEAFEAAPTPPGGLRQRLRALIEPAPPPEPPLIERRANGLLLRLSDAPRAARHLGPWADPAQPAGELGPTTR